MPFHQCTEGALGDFSVTLMESLEQLAVAKTGEAARLKQSLKVTPDQTSSVRHHRPTPWVIVLTPVTNKLRGGWFFPSFSSLAARDDAN